MLRLRTYMYLLVCALKKNGVEAQLRYYIVFSEQYEKVFSQ